MRKVVRILKNGPLKNAFVRSLENWHRAGGARGGERFYSEGKVKNTVNSPLGEITIPNMLFHDFITQNWSLWESKTAVMCGRTGRKYTYRNLLKNTKALAAAFQNKLNLQKGDVIAIVLPNCPEYPIVFIASSMNGVIPTTVNPAYTVDEILHQVQSCKAKLLVTNSEAYPKCVEVAQLIKTDYPILVVKHTPEDIVPPGGIDLLELFDPIISGELKSVDMDMEDTLVLPFSSGTTGGPKGVVITHKNAVSNLSQISHPETLLLNPTTWFHQDSIIIVIPMFHIFGMMVCTFFPLKDGCRLIILPGFNPREFVKNLYMKRVSIFCAVPALVRFLGLPEIKVKYLKHLKYIVNGASALPMKTALQLLEKAEHLKIVQGYGLTETSPVLAHTSTRRMQNLTSIGVPVASTKLKVIDIETGELKPEKERGELCAFGPQVMKGYLNRPEETKNAFDKDGWFRTGDIAYYDENGDFYIVDRLKELIKVKGFQVAPFEVEETLRSHPKIADATVVGIPDKDFGEVPRAFVILKKGAQTSPEEIMDFIDKKLSHYKQLKGGVRFVDDFPKNKMGKVLRHELKTLP